MLGTSTTPTGPVYTPEEVALHNTAKSLWISVEGKVYDVSEFMFDHPGGEEFLLQHAGEDVTDVMKDELDHLHSEVAYELLAQYHIGDLVPSGSKPVPTSPFDGLTKRTASSPQLAPAYTSTLGKKEAFIDLTKPMVQQVWKANFSKAHYLKQVHIPRHSKESAPILGGYLEVFTQTPWWVIPIVWIPIITFFLLKSFELNDPFTAIALFAMGIMNWSVIEYSLHRFLFHVDEIMPDNRFAITAHFLLHGVHHYIPMDKMRLVMPPALSITLAIPIYSLYAAFLPTFAVCAPLAAGTITGYVGYDLMHYYLHHGKPYGAHLKEMKTYHLDHHYKDATLGYGITSKFWDRVFGTVLV
ncbi:fatty acid alpha-hydroxylase [Rhizophlyctis rosea]|uniref:Ceramide very long chain fatty acid hydroxylase n=1 Tax=Rhizophlyctis rosea TaxID=64517 RepID=A0AAD5X1L6_9FUNG|nr:fatty acid alpha-hydroxylase [Rhizophlyctis rosea]